MNRSRKYRTIIPHISTLQLAQPDDLDELNMDDLFTDLTSSRGTSLFLGHYSKRGILFALEKLGILSHLRKMGLDAISVDIDTSQPFRHLFRLFHTGNGRKLVVSELVMRRGTFTLPKEMKLPLRRKSYDILVVEWLLLQNPLADFSEKKPKLPGQAHPGLGLGAEVCEIFYWVGRRAKADGILIVPNYLHTGYLYSSEFYFADPKAQAVVEQIWTTLLRRFTLAQTTWACEKGAIMNQRDNSIFRWVPSEMILPVSKALNDYFFSKYYRSRIKHHKNDFDFTIDQQVWKTAGAHEGES